MLAAWLSGLGLGLLSIPHCAAMCGPLAQAACARSAHRSAPLQYQAGRVVGYAFMGALSGHFGRIVATTPLATWSPLLLALATSLTLLTLAWRVYPHASASSERLVALRTSNAPRSFWSRLQRLLPRHATVFGLSTALLPCGALAASLLIAAHFANPAQAAATMVGFAVASAPGTLAVAWLLQRLPRLKSSRSMRAVSFALVLLACLLIARPIVGLASLARMSSRPSTADAQLHCH